MTRQELIRLVHIFGPSTPKEIFHNIRRHCDIDEINYAAHMGLQSEQLIEDEDGRLHLTPESVEAMLEDDNDSS